MPSSLVVETPYGPSDCTYCGRPFAIAMCPGEGRQSCVRWAIATLRSKQADLAAHLAEAVGLLRAKVRGEFVAYADIEAFLARVDAGKGGDSR